MLQDLLKGGKHVPPSSSSLHIKLTMPSTIPSTMASTMVSLVPSSMPSASWLIVAPINAVALACSAAAWVYMILHKKLEENKNPLLSPLLVSSTNPYKKKNREKTSKLETCPQRKWNQWKKRKNLTSNICSGVFFFLLNPCIHPPIVYTTTPFRNSKYIGKWIKIYVEILLQKRG